MVWCGSAWLCMGFVFSLLRRHVVKTTDTGATQPDLRESKYVEIRFEEHEHVANEHECLLE